MFALVRDLETTVDALSLSLLGVALSPRHPRELPHLSESPRGPDHPL